MKCQLISGGGSRGPFGLALSERLSYIDHDKFIVWSVGSLIGPLAAINEFQLLKQVFFNTYQKDIFNVNPFNMDGSVNKWNFIKRTIGLKATLGETKPLKKLIDTHYKEEHFNMLRRSGKEVIVAASSVESKGLEVEYFSSNECDFETFKLAMWASASPPIYGDIVEINGKQYTDAGTVEILSFEKAIELGSTYIDAIIHRTKFEDKKYITKVTRWWDMLGRIKPAAMGGIIDDKIELGAKYARALGIHVNEYYMSKESDYEPFIFIPEKMTKLYYDS